MEGTEKQEHIYIPSKGRKDGRKNFRPLSCYLTCTFSCPVLSLASCGSTQRGIEGASLSFVLLLPPVFVKGKQREWHQTKSSPRAFPPFTLLPSSSHVLFATSADGLVGATLKTLEAFSGWLLVHLQMPRGPPKSLKSSMAQTQSMVLRVLKARHASACWSKEPRAAKQTSRAECWHRTCFWL